jgi:hypothetical protein
VNQTQFAQVQQELAELKQILLLIVLAFNSHTHSGITTGTGTSGVPSAPINQI